MRIADSTPLLISMGLLATSLLVDGREFDVHKREDYTVPLNQQANSSRPIPDVEPVWVIMTTLMADFFTFGGAPQNFTRGYSMDPGWKWLVDGRVYGGGDRNGIYGSARWGSGAGELVSVAGGWEWQSRPTLGIEKVEYSFGFWPISWGSSGYGGPGAFWYGDGPRPGGGQYVLIFRSQGDPAMPEYFIIGDWQTLKGLRSILKLGYQQGGCEIAVDGYLYNFDPDAVGPNGNHTLHSSEGNVDTQNITILPTNILQYYRTSSVALGNYIYNNTFSANNNTDTNYWGRTPFNATSLYVGQNRYNYTLQDTFLACINYTIAAAIPIINPDLDYRTRFSGQTTVSGPSYRGRQNIIIAISVSSVVLSIILVLLLWRIWVVRKGGSFFPVRAKQAQKGNYMVAQKGSGIVAQKGYDKGYDTDDTDDTEPMKRG